MSGRPIARRSRAPLPSRRVRPVRRASRGLSAARAGAILAMLLSAAAIYGVGASSAFGYSKLQLDGLRYTDPTEVEAALAQARGANLFRLETGPLLTALEGIPTIATARVEVRLPSTLAVTIMEREPLLVWAIGEERFLVDGEGLLFERVADEQTDTAKLPVITDRRAVSFGYHVGTQLSAVDLDAATRLASLVPADVGSRAPSFSVAVGDENGFVLSARPDGWSAVFGFYTPSLRTTDLIPGQVRLLRSLLAERETEVDRVILASETDGTYIPRSTPSPSATADPSAAP
jgi:POTRA domain, FtsQ-type